MEKEVVFILGRKSCDHADFREPKRGKVGDGDVVGTILSVGVQSHPCREY